MKQISILWAQKIELGDKSYNDAPAKLKGEIIQKLQEDGYTVDESGNIARNETPADN